MTTIPGLIFRPAHGEADVDALLAVQRGREARDGIDPLSSAESPATRDALLQGLVAAVAGDALDRYVIAEAGGNVLGYGRVLNWREHDGMRVYLHVGCVLPEWRGRGVGTEMVRRLEARIRELAAASGGQWEYAANASSTEPEATGLLLDNGYRPGYTVLEMGLDWHAFERSPERTLLPSDCDVRPALAKHATAIAQSVYDSYADEYPDNRYREEMDVAGYAAALSRSPFDPLQVAWHGDEIAGQVIPLLARGRAEIDEVSVRPAFRRRGLARALLTRALLDLRARGIQVVRLHTVAEFPTRARDLYESVGFRVLKEFPRYRKPGS